MSNYDKLFIQIVWVIFVTYVFIAIWEISYVLFTDKKYVTQQIQYVLFADGIGKILYVLVWCNLLFSKKTVLYALNLVRFLLCITFYLFGIDILFSYFFWEYVKKINSYPCSYLLILFANKCNIYNIMMYLGIIIFISYLYPKTNK